MKPSRLSLIWVVLACFLASCSALVSSSVINGKPYKFLGVNKITPNGDGTFVLGWDSIPKGSASYNVFVKEGSSADPYATQSQFDFTNPLVKVGDNRYVTGDV